MAIAVRYGKQLSCRSASTGDSGYDNQGAGASYPATSSYTIAVGGTTLMQDSTTLRTKTPGGWSDPSRRAL